MSLGVIPVALIIIGLVVVAAVTSLIAYIVTASRRRSTEGYASSAADQQLADLQYAENEAEIDHTDHVTNRTQSRTQN